MQKMLAIKEGIGVFLKFKGTLKPLGILGFVHLKTITEMFTK